jgi:hypothetical protein
VNAPTTSRIRTWSARTCLALGLSAAIVAAMTALAVASTTEGPELAIPATSLAPLMEGQSSTTRADGSRRAAHHAPIPHSPVGEQLSWLVGEFNGGSATITEAELELHLSTHFLMVVPARGIVLFLRRASDLRGSADLVGFVGHPTPLSATALVETPTHRRYLVRLSVEGRSHHLITSVSIDAQRTSAKV